MGYSMVSTIGVRAGGGRERGAAVPPAMEMV